MIGSRILRLGAPAAFIAALLAASRGPAAAAPQPYTIHAVLSVTGAQSFLGDEEAKTLAVVEKITNQSGGIAGRPLHFVVHDDTSNPQVALQLFNTIKTENPAVVLGSSTVSSCNAMAPVAANGPVLYCFSPGIHPTAGSYVFSSGISTSDSLAATAKFFKARGWKRVATITTTDATGQDADRNIDASFARTRGLTIVAREHFNPDDLSVAAQMAGIKGAHPDVIVAWTTGSPFGTVLHGVSEIGISVPLLTTAANLTRAQMSAYASFMPKRLLFPATAAFALGVIQEGPVKLAVRAFDTALGDAGLRPDNGNALAWDPANLVVGALRKLGPAASSEQLRNYLDNLRSGVGVFGQYDYRSIPQRGVGVSSVVFVRWEAAEQNWIGLGPANI